ncbi:GntR family transcriptional regulator [Streptomyces sp. NPDC087859]|uniref:GntR family transcriptional regulator n=1 Tax=Streptomyces sp. NPDC087859 TaxID=3365812 RepID=UPI003829AFBE
MSESGTGDGGREFERVGDALRARMADGIYPLKSFLPPQRELAQEFGVSRDTVQRVLKELSSEGWIETRQGSGSRVIRRQDIQSSTAKPGKLTLGPLIGEAFSRPEVSLDVYTLTSESLDAHIRLQAERIRMGEISPQSITLRMLLPSESLALPYPRVLADKDDGRLRERRLALTRRHSGSLRTVLNELRVEQLVPSVETHIRHAPLTPTCKLYLLNGVEALHAPYEVIKRTVVLENGEEIPALDALGVGATLTHHVKDADLDSAGSVFVSRMQAWFDSIWDNLAEEAAPPRTEEP